MQGLQAVSQETDLPWSPIERPGCAEREETLVATEWAAFARACVVLPASRAVDACRGASAVLGQSTKGGRFERSSTRYFFHHRHVFGSIRRIHGCGHRFRG